MVRISYERLLIVIVCDRLAEEGGIVPLLIDVVIGEGASSVRQAAGVLLHQLVMRSKIVESGSCVGVAKVEVEVEVEVEIEIDRVVERPILSHFE